MQLARQVCITNSFKGKSLSVTFDFDYVNYDDWGLVGQMHEDVERKRKRIRTTTLLFPLKGIEILTKKEDDK